MRRVEPVTLEYARGFAVAARSAFAFLETGGFELAEYREPASASFRDGFHLRYHSSAVDVRVEYFDMELSVAFVRGATRIDYLLVDHEVFGNASGLAGAMFPLEKLGDALQTVSADVSKNYGQVLRGDPAIWAKIERLANAPVQTRRHPLRDA